MGGINLGVPRAGLLKQDEPGKLALQRSSWEHLLAYAVAVERLPQEFDTGSAATREALDKLRLAAQGIGSPRQLRAALTADPDLLSQKQPPASAYAGAAWLAQRLHAGARAMLGFLENLDAMAAEAGGEGCKQSLLEMGGAAEDGRSGVIALAQALKGSKAGILAANGDLAVAFKADAKLLQSAHEAVGGLKAKVESVRKEIEGLGWFSTRSTKNDLEKRLRALEAELEETSAQAEKLRVAVSQLGPILDQGAWLESGLGDLVDYVEKVNEVWTAVGSGLAQLAADASSTQLGDPVWMTRALGLEAAVKAWQAVDAAAKQFTVQALVDPTGA